MPKAILLLILLSLSSVALSLAAEPVPGEATFAVF